MSGSESKKIVETFIDFEKKDSLYHHIFSKN